jgi:hypothetical protein
MLKKEPMEILEGMLGEELPPEPMFVNLTAEQLERCIQAAQLAITPSPQTAPVPVPVESSRDRLALSSDETAKPIGSSRVALWRLCKRGLLKPSYALRSPRFAVSEIERFLRETRIQ